MRMYIFTNKFLPNQDRKTQQLQSSFHSWSHCLKLYLQSSSTTHSVFPSPSIKHLNGSWFFLPENVTICSSPRIQAFYYTAWIALLKFTTDFNCRIQYTAYTIFFTSHILLLIFTVENHYNSTWYPGSIPSNNTVSPF